MFDSNLQDLIQLDYVKNQNIIKNYKYFVWIAKHYCAPNVQSTGNIVIENTKIIKRNLLKSIINKKYVKIKIYQKEREFNYKILY
jgi:hypothetical protein